MYKYKTEIVKVKFKFFAAKANKKDISVLDEVVNKRAEEGWELVTYSFMAPAGSFRSSFVITFRQEVKNAL